MNTHKAGAVMKTLQHLPSCFKNGGGLGACPAPPVQTANLLVGSRRLRLASFRLKVPLEACLLACLKLGHLRLLVRRQ